MSQTVPHVVQFNTLKFEAAHSKSPRGYGNWAFCPREFYDRDDYLMHTQWYTGKFSDAKKSAAAFFAMQPGVFEIVVCS